MGKAKPGEDYCPQCKRSGLLVHTCRATKEVYCDGWDCMKKAGVPSVVNLPMEENITQCTGKWRGACGIQEVRHTGIARCDLMPSGLLTRQDCFLASDSPIPSGSSPCRKQSSTSCRWPWARRAR